MEGAKVRRHIMFLMFPCIVAQVVTQIVCFPWIDTCGWAKFRLSEHLFESVSAMVVANPSCPHSDLVLSQVVIDAIPDMHDDDRPDIDWVKHKYPHLFTEDNLWAAKESIRHRFPELDGKILWDVACVIYVLHMRKRFRVLKPGFGALLRRSKLNNRNDLSAKQDYKAGIKQEGLR